MLACVQFKKVIAFYSGHQPSNISGSALSNSLHPMATDKELSDFLEDVERRAFKQALYAVRKEESALDVVQDAMIKLAEKYGDKPAAEMLLG